MKQMFTSLILIVISYLCSAQPNATIGGVYVAESYLNNNSLNLDSVKPILAIRIDEIIGDTLLVKYRFGREAFMDADFVYNSDCVCFRSTEKINFSPFGAERKICFITANDEKTMEIFYHDQDVKRTYLYILTYIDTIDLNTHRNPYYAEDGYGLFEK